MCNSYDFNAQWITNSIYNNEDKKYCVPLNGPQRNIQIYKNRVLLSESQIKFITMKIKNTVYRWMVHKEISKFTKTECYGWE